MKKYSGREKKNTQGFLSAAPVEVAGICVQLPRGITLPGEQLRHPERTTALFCRENAKGKAIHFPGKGTENDGTCKPWLGEKSCFSLLLSLVDVPHKQK